MKIKSIAITNKGKKLSISWYSGEEDNCLNTMRQIAHIDGGNSKQVLLSLLCSTHYIPPNLLDSLMYGA